MAQPSTQAPPYLLSRSKAAPTSSSTSLDVTASSTPPQTSRTSSRSRQNSPSRPPLPKDISDRAIESLIRRVLCPGSHGTVSDAQPIDKLLPPLTSSNAVDLQLYAIISIVVKEFVYSWYGKITPDEVFVEEVVRICAHCTRALEQRIRSVDIGSLVLDEIPDLVECHVNAYRASHHPMRPPPLSTDPRRVYHTLVPHPAFSPIPDGKIPSTIEEQAHNERTYRQLLAQGVLAVLLPTEDLENACLRTLVADIIGEMILGNGIGGKACEGWLIWEGITKVVENIKARLKPKVNGREVESDTRSRLERYGLLPEQDDTRKQQVQLERRSSAISKVFWRVLQYGYLTFMTVRFILLGLVAASSKGPRGPATHSYEVSAGVSSTTRVPIVKQPIVRFQIFALAACILDLSNRMPWLSGTVSLSRYHLINGPFRLGATDGALDKFLHHLITSYILTPHLLPPFLAVLRTSLFPNNALAPSRAVPSKAEQVEIKRAAAGAILDIVPPIIARRFFAVHLGAGDDTHDGENHKAARERAHMLDEIEDVLDLFSDPYMNKHLIFGILELCIVRLVPEVGEMGPKELMEARLG